MIDGGFDHPNPFEPFPTVSLLNPLYIIAEYVFLGSQPGHDLFPWWCVWDTYSQILRKTALHQNESHLGFL